jgi:ABC-type cobalamin/Fe3+-siderophores transport system ATPase subunit
MSDKMKVLKMGELTVKFPHNEEIKFESGKPVVVLGANGSGKTRFSVGIEELNDPKFNRWNTEETMLVHRISAQKSLSISDSISILDYESSSKTLFYGTADQHANKLGHRFNGKPATFLLDDYNKALSLLFAEKNRQLEIAHDADKAAFAEGNVRPDPITTVVEQATQIWNSLLPQRKIDLKRNGVHAICGDVRYHGKEMSDGERVMLYMICQVLVLKPNSLLIIDEPELHIHKAIVNKLWDKLEECRQDCVFMYITHDLSFALSRNTEDVLWIKSFDGKNWDYEFLKVEDYSDLPPDLLYEIIGTRQKILFVEGEKNSYDHFLYQEIFRDKGYHVIPCGGCQEVIKFVKSKRAYEKLNSIEVYGIIDRDFRTDEEIEALKKDRVYCLTVAEVENLFVVPGLLDIMAKQLGCTDGTAKTAKDFIVDLYNKNKNNQVGEAFVMEMSHQLTLTNFEDKKLVPTEIHALMNEIFSIEKIETVLNKKQAIFDAATTVDEILKVFNFKELSTKVGAKFELTGNKYPQHVVNLIKGNPSNVKESILATMERYIPQLPQRS